MKNKKRILSIAVSSIMTLSSVSVLAVNGDIKDKATEQKFTDAITATLNSSIANQLILGSGNYLYELDGKNYTVSDLLDAYEKAADKSGYLEDLKQNYPPVSDVQGELKVESISAINAKTLKVTFNSAVAEADQANAKFSVKRGSANVGATATWAEDGKSVELASSANLIAGDHTVTVEGLTEEALTGAVTVEAVKATELAIKANVLNGATAKSKLNVELKDQYGEDIKLTNSAFTATAFNKTQNAPVTVAFDTTDGFYINTTNPTNFKKDDVVTVTVLHNATGLKVIKDLTVNDAATLNTVTVGDIVLPTGKTLLTEDLTNVKAPISGQDQFGSDVKLQTSDLKIVSSDEDVLKKANVTVTADGKNLNIAKFEKAGTVTLTILVQATGETATLTLDVQAKAGEITTVTLAETAGTIATGATKTIAMDVQDNYGDAIKVSDYTGKFTFGSTNQALVDTSGSDVQINAKGELEIKTKSGVAKGSTTTVTLIYDNKEIAKYVVTAGEAVAPTAINVSDKSEHSTKVGVGANTTITFGVNDQYGDSVAYGDLGTNTVSLKAKTGSESLITVLDNSDYTAKVTAKAAGTAVVVAELKNSAGDVVSSQEVTIEVVENTSEGLVIGDITDLAAVTNSDTVYAENVEVKTADGATLPQSSIISITSNHAAVEVVGNKVVGIAANLDKDANNKAIDTTATITVIYNADDKPVTLTKEVKVLAKKVAVDSVMLIDKDLTASAKKLPTDAVVKTSTSIADFDADLSGLFVVVKDNFGVYHGAKTTGSDIDSVSLTVANKVGYKDVEGDDAVKIDTRALKVDGTKFSADNLITSDSGKASFRIVITAGTKFQAVDVAVDGKTDAQTTADGKIAAAITAIGDSVELANGTAISKANVEAKLVTLIDDVSVTPTATQIGTTDSFTVELKATDGVTKTITVAVTVAEA